MLALDTNTNSGYVIMHSWPNAPVVGVKEQPYLLYTGSFDNTQHALCMNLGTVCLFLLLLLCCELTRLNTSAAGNDMNTFLEEDISTFPRLIYTNYGTQNFHRLPPLLYETLLKLRIPNDDKKAEMFALAQVYNFCLAVIVCHLDIRYVWALINWLNTSPKVAKTA